MSRLGVHVLLLELCWRRVAQRFQHALRVGPRDPFKCRTLDVLDGPRRRMPSVSYSPITDSASALSDASPTVPTEATSHDVLCVPGQAHPGHAHRGHAHPGHALYLKIWSSNKPITLDEAVELVTRARGARKRLAFGWQRLTPT